MMNPSKWHDSGAVVNGNALLIRLDVRKRHLLMRERGKQQKPVKVPLNEVSKACPSLGEKIKEFFEVHP